MIPDNKELIDEWKRHATDRQSHYNVVRARRQRVNERYHEHAEEGY